MTGLCEVLAFSACLLFLVQCGARTASTPIPATKLKLWVNPCGASPRDQREALTDKQLLQNILLKATVARDAETDFKKKFVKDLFQNDFLKLEAEWKGTDYEWLPFFPVPKYLFPDVTAHLDEIGVQLEPFLQNSYHDLQIMAVALEQVEWDWGHAGNEQYKASFLRTQQRLRLVLCEVLTALEEKDLPHNDKERSRMPDQYRYIEGDTERYTRDFIIYRDYLRVLHYIIHVSKYFIAKV